MPDSLIINESPARPPVSGPPVGSSVTSCLAALNAIRDLLNANEDESQDDALGEAHGTVQALFVAEPVRSISDAVAKLEWVVGEEALDSIDEDIIKGVLAYLRSKVQ